MLSQRMFRPCFTDDLSLRVCGNTEKAVSIFYIDIHFYSFTGLHLQLLLMPILDGKAVLYSFVSIPEVRIGVAFGSGGSQSLPATELPGVSSWLVGFLYDCTQESIEFIYYTRKYRIHLLHYVELLQVRGIYLFE